MFIGVFLAALIVLVLVLGVGFVILRNRLYSNAASTSQKGAATSVSLAATSLARGPGGLPPTVVALATEISARLQTPTPEPPEPPTATPPPAPTPVPTQAPVPTQPPPPTQVPPTAVPAKPQPTRPPAGPKFSVTRISGADFQAHGEGFKPNEALTTYLERVDGADCVWSGQPCVWQRQADASGVYDREADFSLVTSRGQFRYWVVGAQSGKSNVVAIELQ